MATALETKDTLAIDRALQNVTSAEGLGVYASADVLFKGAVFGRDSLEVAEDLMNVKPHLVERVLLTLARMQGTRSAELNEEEPGKIVHEYRSKKVDGKPLDDISQVIFDELYGKWGGEGEQLAYFGSVDATPHFIRVVADYTDKQDKHFLKRHIIRRDGSETTMVKVLEDAIDWVLKKLDSSTSGLLEYRRTNPDGIQNQVWKDSAEFYVHTNKQIANHDKPVASIEVQGLTYDALLAASVILPKRKAEIKAYAEKLRKRTFELLWNPDNNYFSLGTDHDSEGKMRVLQTTTANPAALLDTRIFDNLPKNIRKQYTSGIVSMIFSKDFLTDAGIRSRALSEADLIPFWDYHGSFVSWPKETYDIAKGLKRQGFHSLAAQLENRLLNVTHRSGIFPEFFYIDEAGRVLFPPNDSVKTEKLIEVDGTNRPEAAQAWTISAIMGIMADAAHGPIEVAPEEAWELDLEAKVLKGMNKMDILDGNKLASRYPYYSFKLIRDKSKSFNSYLHEKIDQPFTIPLG